MLKRMMVAASLMAGLMLCTPASAQEYQNFFFFGDSLSDNGNLFAATGGAVPASPPYYQGRFSNGPVWVEYFVPNVAKGPTVPVATNLDFAFAGAQSGVVMSPPGGLVQLGIFQQIIAAGANSLEGDDLVSVWLGANNYLDAIEAASPATLADPVALNTLIGNTAAAAASDIGTLIGGLATMGAKTVMVMNLPDLGRTPGLSALGLANVGSLAAATHNAALAQAVAGVKAAFPDVNIISVDTNTLLNLFISEPARFGLENVTEACLDAGTGVPCAADTAGQNKYLFWDGTHPTTGVHALFAEAVRTLSDTLGVVRNTAAQSEAGLITARAADRTVALRLRQIRAGLGAVELGGASLALGQSGYQSDKRALRAMAANVGKGAGQSAGQSGDERRFSVFVNADYAFGSRGAPRPGLSLTEGFSYDLSSITLGADFVVSDGLVIGVAGTYADNSVDYADGISKFDMTTYQGTAFATYYSDSFYVDASFGYGDSSYKKIARFTGVTGIIAGGRTNGQQLTATANAGYVYSVGNLTIGPTVGVRYINVDVDPYTETGGSIFNIAYGKQDVQSFVVALGGQASGRFKMGSVVMVPQLRVAYEAELDGNRTLVGQLLNNTANPAALSDSVLDDDTLVIGGGVMAAFSDSLSLIVDFTSAVGIQGGSENQLSGQLRLRF